MSRSKQYITSLLDGVPLEELADFEHRSAFQQIKERIAGAEDVAGELKVLYRVNRFSDFALSMLWIADRAERDPSALEPGVEEQTLVLSAFRHAIGDAGEVIEQTPAAPVPEPIVEEPVAAAPQEPEVAETTFDMPTQPAAETPAGFDAFGAATTEEAPSGFGPASEATTDFPATPTSEAAAPMGDFPSFPSSEATAEPM
ncbi:MAG TPA: hypothetical protein VII11_04470, partial [Bacteroidota bacterium]